MPANRPLRLSGVRALLGLCGIAISSTATAQTVEFRLREMTGQSMIGSSGDAVLDFVIEGRVVGASETTGIASFGLYVLSWNGESSGTFARLRINNADRSIFTGAPTTSTTGGSFAGVGYPFRAMVAQDAASNGLVNPPTSATGFTNTACNAELSGILGLSSGTFLVNTLDADGDGIPDSSPLNGTGQIVPEGSIAPLDPIIGTTFFGSNGSFVPLYRLRYTLTNLGPLTITAHVSGTPTVFTRVQKTAAGWQPVQQQPASVVLTATAWINGFFGNPVDLCPPDFDRQNGVNSVDLFGFLNAWFNSCTAGTCQRSADHNCNGLLDAQDIFDFLNDWFVGCP